MAAQPSDQPQGASLCHCWRESQPHGPKGEAGGSTEIRSTVSDTRSPYPQAASLLLLHVWVPLPRADPDSAHREDNKREASAHLLLIEAASASPKRRLQGLLDGQKDGRPEGSIATPGFLLSHNHEKAAVHSRVLCSTQPVQGIRGLDPQGTPGGEGGEQRWRSRREAARSHRSRSPAKGCHCCADAVRDQGLEAAVAGCRHLPALRSPAQGRRQAARRRAGDSAHAPSQCGREVLGPIP